MRYPLMIETASCDDLIGAATAVLADPSGCEAEERSLFESILNAAVAVKAEGGYKFDWNGIENRLARTMRRIDAIALGNETLYRANQSLNRLGEKLTAGDDF